jgi:hypothetical protein
MTHIHLFLVLPLFPQALPVVLLACGVVAVNVILSFQAFLILLLHISIVLLLHLKVHRLFSYLFLLIILILACHPLMNDIKSELFEQDQFRSFFFDVSLVWLSARCISFTCDRLDSKTTKQYIRQQYLEQFDFIFSTPVPPFTNHELISVFAYLFYLPTFFTGPINQYDSFVQVRLDWSL